jgi:hypothetical protein
LISKTVEYVAWADMKQRCNNQNIPCYSNYGGRGIAVCDEWSNSFKSFLDDMGYRPSNKHSLDRIDNSKGYSTANCKWSTVEEQLLNRRQFVSCLNEKHIIMNGSRFQVQMTRLGRKMQYGSHSTLAKAITVRDAILKTFDNYWWYGLAETVPK